MKRWQLGAGLTDCWRDRSLRPIHVWFASKIAATYLVAELRVPDQVRMACYFVPTRNNNVQAEIACLLSGASNSWLRLPITMECFPMADCWPWLIFSKPCGRF